MIVRVLTVATLVCALGAATQRATCARDADAPIESPSYQARAGDLEVWVARAADAPYESRLHVVKLGSDVLDREFDGLPTGLHLVPVAGRAYPLVFVAVARGGRRCCFAGYVLDANATEPPLRSIAFGSDASAVMLPIGPDGEYQLRTFVATNDAFGSAESADAVPRVLAFRDDTFSDVTSEHADLVRGDREAHRKSLAATGRRSESGYRSAALAYLADSYTLGESTAAWAALRDGYRGDFAAFETVARQWLMEHGYHDH